MQADPIKPTLKAPGMKLLKLRYDKPPSNFAFKINLRRYMKDSLRNNRMSMMISAGQGLTLVHSSAQSEPFLTQIHTLNTP